MIMPSLAQLGIIEWKQLKQLIFRKWAGNTTPIKTFERHLMHVSTPYGSWDIFLAWAGNTDNKVPGEQEHPQYVQIVSNNIYAKFSAAMTNIIEAIWKKNHRK